MRARLCVLRAASGVKCRPSAVGDELLFFCCSSIVRRRRQAPFAFASFVRLLVCLWTRMSLKRATSDEATTIELLVYRRQIAAICSPLVRRTTINRGTRRRTNSRPRLLSPPPSTKTTTTTTAAAAIATNEETSKSIACIRVLLASENERRYRRWLRLFGCQTRLVCTKIAEFGRDARSRGSPTPQTNSEPKIKLRSFNDRRLDATK